MKNGTLDMRQLAIAIQNMTRRQEVYRVLKLELTKKGYWKSLPRGDPRKGYRMKNHLVKANRL